MARLMDPTGLYLILFYFVLLGEHLVKPKPKRSMFLSPPSRELTFSNDFYLLLILLGPIRRQVCRSSWYVSKEASNMISECCAFEGA